MLFSQKAKGFFVELNDHAVMLARTSAPVAPFTVEDVRECPPNDAAALEEAINQIQPKKSPSGYLHATVGIYPAKRLLRRHSLELKRVKEPGYFAEVCSQQFRIEQEKYTINILNANDGSDFDIAKGVQKDVLFCGIPAEEADTSQSALLESHIYPERLELGSVSTLGGVVDCLAQSKSKTPTLVLEIGTDATHSFIVTAGGVEASRPIPQGLDAMVPIVQKELGLKDEESARKLFYSNTFDFTGMGPLLTKKLLKELQSSIGFYEVQTGQSVGQVLSTQLSPKLTWLDAAIASALGITSLKLDPVPWLQSRQITLAEAVAKNAQEIRWFGLLSLMAQYNVVHAVPAEEKSETAGQALVPPWHPNFRNYEKLPDIKVVRTAFFINAAAIFVAVSLALYFGQQAWRLHVYGVQIADYDRQISRDKAASDQAVAQFKKFQTEEAKINEVDAFVKSKPIVSDLILHLASTLPSTSNIAFDNLDLHDTGLVLRLAVRGTSEAAAGYANTYLEQLKGDKQLLERFEPADITNETRNPTTGRLAVEITLRTKGPKK